MKTVAVYSLKGGVGKTTLAVNLALASATRSARRTLLWDLDPQAAASWLLGPHLPKRRDAQAVFAKDVDPAKLTVRTILNGAERQSYRISDMIFSAQQLVSKISHDMTLLPGDLIACGTSVGIGVMKEPVNTVTVAIDGIGELTNEFRQ